MAWETELTSAEKEAAPSRYRLERRHERRTALCEILSRSLMMIWGIAEVLLFVCGEFLALMLNFALIVLFYRQTRFARRLYIAVSVWSVLSQLYAIVFRDLILYSYSVEDGTVLVERFPEGARYAVIGINLAAFAILLFSERVRESVNRREGST